MVNSSATFPIFSIPEDSTQDFLARARALAAEEHVSLPKYLAGMLRHAIRGDNLANIHFYQDGSGDTYDVEEVRRTHEETLAESAAGLTTVCNTMEESDEHFRKLREEVEKEKEKQQNVSRRIFQKVR
ncbi:MAG: hypothetical protein LBQ23_00395 [Puniceicoccales bacterium]|jgi:hypothetical protein|nr:hypothetical protein [Puniceicoccales bacterium]